MTQGVSLQRVQVRRRFLIANRLVEQLHSVTSTLTEVVHGSAQWSSGDQLVQPTADKLFSTDIGAGPRSYLSSSPP